MKRHTGDGELIKAFQFLVIHVITFATFLAYDAGISDGKDCNKSINTG